MLRSENVATPSTAVAVMVPDSVPATTKPPLCPIAIVTGPLKLVTRLPSASNAMTWTAGSMGRVGRVVPGSMMNSKCSGGLSASTVVSQLLGGLSGKYQVHWGSTEPPAARTAKSASRAIAVSDTAVTCVKSAGGSRPTTEFAMVTAYASAPGPSAIEPGPAVVMPAPTPVAAR